MYSQDVPANSGTPDKDIYPEVAQRSCVFLTADYHQRYRRAERLGLVQQGIRHFVLPGNLGGDGLAKLIVLAKNNIFEYCRKHDPPFSVDVHRDGTVHPRMNKEGIIYGRKKPKS